MTSIVIFFFGVFTAVVGFISATSTMYDPYGRGISKITWAGWKFIICACILIALPIVQNSISEKIQKRDQDARDNKLKANYDSSILIMQQKFDSSNQVSATIITETLGKYGYKLDSTNMVLVSINNTSNKRIEPAPVFGLSIDDTNPGIVLTDSSNNNYKMKMVFVSQNAGSSFFKMSISVASEGQDGVLHYLKINNKENFLPFSFRAPKDAPFYQNSDFKTDNKLKYLYLRLNGHYKTIEGYGDYKVDEVYKFSVNDNKVGLMVGVEKIKIISFLSKNK